MSEVPLYNTRPFILRIRESRSPAPRARSGPARPVHHTSIYSQQMSVYFQQMSVYSQQMSVYSTHTSVYPQHTCIYYQDSNPRRGAILSSRSPAPRARSGPARPVHHTSVYSQRTFVYSSVYSSVHVRLSSTASPFVRPFILQHTSVFTPHVRSFYL